MKVQRAGKLQMFKKRPQHAYCHTAGYIHTGRIII